MITLTSPTTRELAQPWRNAIAVGRAFDLTRKDLLDHLAFLQREIGYRYCRYHAVFDDDMGVVVRRADGSLAYQWHHVDQVYDALLAIGLRPFVELNPMPAALASGTQTMFDFDMNVTPPKDYGQWEHLVEAFTRHLVDRYGMNEVRQWYFEVWNEPNLNGFWSGTMADYFVLYDASARAVKRVDDKLRIGGPATSKASWIEEFITHCHRTGSPVDFLSTHLYPQDEYVDYHDRNGSPHVPGAYFTDRVKAVTAQVRASSLPHLEIHWTEWNSLSTSSSANIEWINNRHVDDLHGAAVVARSCIALDGAADTLCWWVASDVFFESGLSSCAYSFTYGLLTIHGIPKASFHAFRFLKQLSGRVMAEQRSGTRPAAADLIATWDGQVLRIMAWNFRILEDATPPGWRETVTLPCTGPARLLTAVIGEGHGSAWESWVAMGRPHNLSVSEDTLLRAHATPTWQARLVAPVAGLVALDLDLAPGEVLYAELRAQGEEAMPRKADAKALAVWNKNMGEVSR